MCIFVFRKHKKAHSKHESRHKKKVKKEKSDSSDSESDSSSDSKYEKKSKKKKSKKEAPSSSSSESEVEKVKRSHHKKKSKHYPSDLEAVENKIKEEPTEEEKPRHHHHHHHRHRHHHKQERTELSDRHNLQENQRPRHEKPHSSDKHRHSSKTEPSERETKRNRQSHDDEETNERRHHDRNNRTHDNRHDERNSRQQNNERGSQDRRSNQSHDRPQSSSNSHHRDRGPKKPFCDASDEYEWGRKDANNEDIKNNAQQPKQKPDFGLSGKLTEDTNTYNGVVIKYSEPPDARKPKRRWRLYPFKGDTQLPVLHIHRQSAFLMGRDRKVADIPVDHPSCSKQHAALQYRLTDYTREDGSKGKRIRLYIIDLESANGTFVNNKKIDPKRYVELLEKDVIKFGFSSREYVLLHEHSKDSDYDDDVQDD